MPCLTLNRLFMVMSCAALLFCQTQPPLDTQTAQMMQEAHAIEDMVTITTSDEQTFTISRIKANHSATIRNLLDDKGARSAFILTLY